MNIDDFTKNVKRSEQPSCCLQFVKESLIQAPPKEVFGFHESPEALRQLIPPWESMKIVQSSGSIEVASRVVLAGRVLGLIPVRWVAVHTEYDPPHLFADQQQSGPFAWWYHRHRFLDDGSGGTILRDEVDYQLPLGRIGKWLGSRMVRRKLDAMFDYRHQVTRRIVESMEWRASADARAGKAETHVS